MDQYNRRENSEKKKNHAYKEIWYLTVIAQKERMYCLSRANILPYRKKH